MEEYRQCFFFHLQFCSRCSSDLEVKWLKRATVVAVAENVSGCYMYPGIYISTWIIPLKTGFYKLDVTLPLLILQQRQNSSAWAKCRMLSFFKKHFIEVLLRYKKLHIFNVYNLMNFGIRYTSGPQPFWHQGRVSWETIFPRVGGGGDGSGGNEMGSGRWSFDCSPLTSCCATWFLTGCRPVAVRGLGVGDPWDTPMKPSPSPSSRPWTYLSPPQISSHLYCYYYYYYKS